MKQALRDALDARGYENLTPVQTAVLEPELEGQDMLVSAQTGSGKTVGFGLAVAPTLLEEAERFDRPEAPLALVIAPTRELALQVKRELTWLFEKAGAVVASCVGGMDMRDERRALERGAHIVAATPGRLRDHIKRGSIDLTNIRAVVLDEADEMLDLGFREDLEFILDEAPEDRQTLLFSATVPKSIAELAKTYQQDAQRIVVKAEGQQHADIAYRAMMIAEQDVDNAVINTLRFYEAPNAIVFANTRAMVARLTTRLSNRGFQVVSLSGELTQTERTHALQAMRDGRAQVCVATDVAARGIDLPGLDLVVHAELPSNHETLLHRSGRTGRAGRSGVSALIVTRRSRSKANRLLGWAKLKAEWTNAPSADEINAKDAERMLADPIWQDPTTEAELPSVEQLLEAFSPQKLATSYLRLLRNSRSAPEELQDPEAKPGPRAEFGPSQWFRVSAGREENIGPRNLVPMLCRNGKLHKGDIGAIRVKPHETFVQLKAEAAPKLAMALGADLELEKGVNLTQMDEAPEQERGGDRGGDRRGPKPGGKFGGKPGGRGPRKEFDDRPRKSGPRDDRKRDGKPWDDKPKKDWSKTKPADHADRGDKPFKKKPFDKAEGGKGFEGKPLGKPKPDARPKPADKPRADKPKKEERPAPQKPKFDVTDPSASPRRKGKGGEGSPFKRRDADKPKGPPPPKGKPNSKKNKARLAAAKALKGKK
ncbi:MAG: DEAD/DEAH box helicase [Pelagimonas sp.]|nr:DEAD/DEAH box helicase [Pelagimonas sp.]